jgi:hypothetical protein
MVVGRGLLPRTRGRWCRLLRLLDGGEPQGFGVLGVEAFRDACGFGSFGFQALGFGSFGFHTLGLGALGF